MSLNRFKSFFATMALLGSSVGFGLTFAHAEQIKLNAALAKPTMLAGEKAFNYLKVKLTGFDLRKAAIRPPVNIAIVLDRSGSMKGEKIQQAKRAALAAVDRLRDDDIVSVVTYDTNVQVLVPATRASDRDSIRQAIESIQADGNTALFAGVSKGAAEVRKFLDDKHVNRIILLSDGLANAGPSSPTELEQLGQSLLKEKISVSTLGLGSGYNEDLMTSLAAASSGNHVFIENADNLVGVFNNEFDDLLSVVASEFDIQITLANSMRPVRSLGNKADIHGQVIRIPLAQLYARQERYFILEVEVAAGENGQESPLADDRVEYRNQPLAWRWVVPDEIIRQVLTQSKLSLDRKGILISSDLNAGRIVEMDSDVSEQILINLINNVEKYAVDGKSLHVSSLLEGDILTVDVVDSGPGIPPRFRQKNFQPFYRLDDGNTAPSGTDLGLEFCMDGLIVYPKKLKAIRNNATINITVRELQLLQLLYDHAGDVVTRDLIFNLCWGYSHVPNSRTLDQMVSQLRNRIERDPKNPKIIRTVYGAGYRYEA